MRAGTMREMVTIQAMVPANDPQYGQTEQPQAVATVWASVVGNNGTEVEKDEGITAITTYDVQMRYIAGITSANSLLWNGITLEILSVVNDPKRTTLTIVAKQIA
jgi:SPP1 family predicted phage head-tail adaptor